MPLNRPTQDELLEAVTEYLNQPVHDAKADGFYRRVAANVLNVVRREQQLAPSFEQKETELLQNLLDCDKAREDLNAQLQAKIENGEMAITEQLTETLLEISRLKLGIDNPRYG